MESDRFHPALAFSSVNANPANNDEHSALVSCPAGLGAEDEAEGEDEDLFFNPRLLDTPHQPPSTRTFQHGQYSLSTSLASHSHSHYASKNYHNPLLPVIAVADGGFYESVSSLSRGDALPGCTVALDSAGEDDFNFESNGMIMYADIHSISAGIPDKGEARGNIELPREDVSAKVYTQYGTCPCPETEKPITTDGLTVDASLEWNGYSSDSPRNDNDQEPTAWQASSTSHTAQSQHYRDLIEYAPWNSDSPMSLSNVSTSVYGVSSSQPGSPYSKSSSPNPAETAHSELDIVPSCTNCSTNTTPLWRRDTDGRPMCNACGLFFKLHGIQRPLSLKTDVIKRRRRGSETLSPDGRRIGARKSRLSGRRA